MARGRKPGTRLKIRVCDNRDCGSWRPGHSYEGDYGRQEVSNNCACYANGKELFPDNCEGFISHEKDKCLRTLSSDRTTQEQKEEAEKIMKGLLY